MPALPDREVLIDLKNNDPAEGERLATYLATLSAERLTTISVYGGDASVGVVAARSFTPSTTDYMITERQRPLLGKAQ